MSTQPFLGQSPKPTTITPPLSTAYQFNVVAPTVNCTSVFAQEMKSVNITSSGLTQTTMIINSTDLLNQGNVTVGSRLTVGSQLIVGSQLTVGTQLTVGSQLAVGSDLIVSGKTTLNSDLTVSAKTTLTSGLSVTGGGTTTLATGLSVSGTVTFNSACIVDFTKVSSVAFPTNLSLSYLTLSNPMQFYVGGPTNSNALVYKDTFNPTPIFFASSTAYTTTLGATTGATIYSWNQVSNPVTANLAAAATPPPLLNLPAPQANLLGKTINFTRLDRLPSTGYQITPANLAATVLTLGQLASNSLSASAQTFALGTFWQKVGFVCSPDPNCPNYSPGFIWDRYFYQ